MDNRQFFPLVDGPTPNSAQAPGTQQNGREDRVAVRKGFYFLSAFIGIFE
jgi:hypothetical protein